MSTFETMFSLPGVYDRESITPHEIELGISPEPLPRRPSGRSPQRPQVRGGVVATTLLPLMLSVPLIALAQSRAFGATEARVAQVKADPGSPGVTASPSVSGTVLGAREFGRDRIRPPAPKFFAMAYAGKLVEAMMNQAAAVGRLLTFQIDDLAEKIDEATESEIDFRSLCVIHGEDIATQALFRSAVNSRGKKRAAIMEALAEAGTADLVSSAISEYQRRGGSVHFEILEALLVDRDDFAPIQAVFSEHLPEARHFLGLVARMDRVAPEVRAGALLDMVNDHDIGVLDEVLDALRMIGSPHADPVLAILAKNENSLIASEAASLLEGLA